MVVFVHKFKINIDKDNGQSINDVMYEGEGLGQK